MGAKNSSRTVTDFDLRFSQKARQYPCAGSEYNVGKIRHVIGSQNGLTCQFSNKLTVLSYFVRTADSGVQRMLYISRTEWATKNLIWYSESAENYLSHMAQWIFIKLSSSGSYFNPKMGNFLGLSKVSNFKKNVKVVLKNRYITQNHVMLWQFCLKIQILLKIYF